MKNICLIPARGGSKRIHKKNIKLFFGKPLIAWSIEIAKSTGIFENIYVSTDNKEIAKIAKEYGAIIPFLRPDYLSDDFAIDKEVRDHFIEWINISNIKVDTLCYLYATAPFLTKEIIIGVKELLINSGATMAQTVSTYNYPPLKALKSNQNGFLNFMWSEYAEKRTQEIPELIHDAGQCYFFNLNKYSEEEKIIGYSIPRLLCQDIDTLEDFEFAEKLFQLVKEKN